jgi:hypothetical protein
MACVVTISMVGHGVHGVRSILRGGVNTIVGPGVGSVLRVGTNTIVGPGVSNISGVGGIFRTLIISKMRMTSLAQK